MSWMCVGIVEGNFRELKREEGGMGTKHQARERARENGLRWD